MSRIARLLPGVLTRLLLVLRLSLVAAILLLAGIATVASLLIAIGIALLRSIVAVLAGTVLLTGLLAGLFTAFTRFIILRVFLILVLLLFLFLLDLVVNGLE